MHGQEEELLNKLPTVSGSHGTKRSISEISGGAGDDTDTANSIAAAVNGTGRDQSPLGSPMPPSQTQVGIPMTRQVSLPGARFRQHLEFLEMQVEVDEGDAVANRLMHFASKNKVLLNMILRNNVNLLESSFSPFVFIPRCRQLLHFDIKRAFFKLRLKRIRQSVQRNHGSLRLNVSRSTVFQDSFRELRFKNTTEMRRRLAITFRGEEGIDAGGVTREWYGLMAREIFNPHYALFCPAGDSLTFQPNPISSINEDHLDYFKFVGRLIGKAICDGHLLDAHFSRSFYKHILGIPVSPLDMEAIDPEYYKTLKFILDTPIEYLGLDLTFSAETNDFGKNEIVDLIPGGQEIEVTDENKGEYVRLIAHHRMTTSIRQQIDAFLEGFHELVRPELVSIFDAQELELLISGLPEIDLDDLRGNTDYHGYKASDPSINWFWNTLRSFSKEEKALFLQFVTGTAKVPLDGFKALQGAEGMKRFNIHKAYGEDKLPSAHTCFNQLDLPEYPSEEVMKEKLLVSIKEGSEGFGFA
jgi:E3 ubiquitin-protein ligase HUWE1